MTNNPHEYDIQSLLQYRGPILREPEPLQDGVGLIDYRNTDENESRISLLLSSQGIHFNIVRPPLGLSPKDSRMIVTVPRNQCTEAEAILASASAAGAIEPVPGTRGILSR